MLPEPFEERERVWVEDVESEGEALELVRDVWLEVAAPDRVPGGLNEGVPLKETTEGVAIEDAVAASVACALGDTLPVVPEGEPVAVAIPLKVYTDTVGCTDAVVQMELLLLCDEVLEGLPEKLAAWLAERETAELLDGDAAPEAVLQLDEEAVYVEEAVVVRELVWDAVVVVESEPERDADSELENSAVKEGHGELLKEGEALTEVEKEGEDDPKGLSDEVKVE